MIAPFNFKKKETEYLLTNDLGRYIYLDELQFEDFIHERLDPESELYDKLKQNFFHYDTSTERYIEEIKPHLRAGKSYLFSATSLHIFVVTNYCNARCVYCQAESGGGAKHHMSREVARRAVDIALQSPQRELSFEFQGGEPLSNFPVIRFIVEYAEAHKKDKIIQYNVVSNLVLLTEDMIDFFAGYGISISTSLDGDQQTHDKNRPLADGRGYFDILERNIRRLQDRGLHPGAIQTTTAQTMDRYKEMIDQYIEFGLDMIFIRPLTPLGFALERWDDIGYSMEEFQTFYSNCLDYLMQCNQRGHYIKEGHASIFLSKILNGYGLNYMELRSPCGASVGQMAYYYDGNVFTCDEGRMLYEMGDNSFQLGNVMVHHYDDLMESGICKAVCRYSVIESLPTCAECVYQPYCGTCPVLNYALEKDIMTRKIKNYRCKTYGGMLDKIFELLHTTDYTDILRSWVL